MKTHHGVALTFFSNEGLDTAHDKPATRLPARIQILSHFHQRQVNRRARIAGAIGGQRHFDRRAPVCPTH